MRAEETNVISSRTTFTVIHPNGTTPVATTMTWDPNNPLAVTVTFKGHRARWDIARNILHTGLLKPVGDGDVRVRPLPELGLLELILDAPNGFGWLLMSRLSVRRFLTRTFKLVPLDAVLVVPEPPAWWSSTTI